MTDFAPLPDETHAGIVLLYDDTMPAYRVASGLIAMVDTYPDRDRRQRAARNRTDVR